MALVLADRVQQTGTANTTVSFTLSGSVTGFRTFAAANITNNDTTYYAATDASGNWEVGIGTYSTTGPTLTRTTILSSSNSGSAVTFSGTVNVFVTYPSEKSVNYDAADNVGIGTTSPTELLQVNAGAGATARALVGGGSTAVLVINGDRDNSGDTGTEDASLIFQVDGVYNNALNSGLGSNGFRLGLLNSAGANSLSFVSVLNSVDSEVMRLDSSGNVGIGTSPTVALDVVGTSGTIEISTSTTDATDKFFRFGGGHYTAAEEGVTLISGSASSGANNVNLGGGTGVLNAATILRFYTAADTTTTGGTERMRIDSSGNVGIGTTAPLAELNVNGTGGELIRISVTPNAGVIQEPALGFATGDTNTHPAAKISALEFDASDSRASLLFYTRNSNSDVAPTERLRIGSTGQFTFTCADMEAPNPTAVNFNTTAKLLQTGNTTGVLSTLNTDATYTGAGSVYGFYANVGTFTVTPTNAYGFFVGTDWTGATNNYGYYSNIAAATGRYNFYAAGDADNYFAGDVGIGTTAPAYKLDVQATGDAVLRLKSNSSGAAADDDAFLILDAAETGEAVLSFRTDGTQIGFLESSSTTGFLKVATTAASGDYITFFPAEAEAVRINAAGTLLAGTVFTEYTLGAITAPVQISGTTQNTSSLTTLIWSQTSGSEPNIVLGKGYSTTPGTYTATASGQNMGQIAFAASDGTAINTSAGIVASTTGTWSGSSRPSTLEFYVTASGTTSTTTTLGITPTGLTSQPVYDNTAAGSTVIVTSAGLIRRTSSSLKYKKDVEDLDSLLVSNAVDNLRPVWYRTKNAAGDDKETWSHIGLIAEEVHTVEPRLVRYRTVEVTKDENDKNVETLLDTPEPEDVDYGRLAVLLLAEVKSLKASIAVLKDRITVLEAK